jgi:cell division protein FtsQ
MKSELLLVQAESANDLRFLLKENRLVRFGNSQSQVEKFRVLKTLLTIPASVYDVSAPNLPITRK